MRRFGIGIVFLVMLTACTTGDSGFRTVEGMASRPDMAREIVSQCIDLISLRPRGQREEVAALMGVPAAKVPGAYCGRVVKALASGRLTVDDWNAMRQGNSTDNLIKVVRGRK